VLELRLSREEMPPFTPFLPADEPTYYVEPLGSASPGQESANRAMPTSK
jgi:hypothetical protein